MVITGGQLNLHGASFVTKYDINGWIEDLPELNTGRLGHGCAHFYNNLNELVNRSYKIQIFGPFVISE